MCVTLFPVGSLKRYLKGADHTVLEKKEGQSLKAVCEEIGLPVNLISIFIVNGEPKTKDYLLQPHDEIKLISLVGGG